MFVFHSPLIYPYTRPRRLSVKWMEINLKTVPHSLMEAQKLPPPNQKIIPKLKDSRFKSLIHIKHYRCAGNSTTSMKNSLFVSCPMFSPSLGELINHVRQAVSLDFFPSLNKPVHEFTHGLVLHIVSRHRRISYGSPRSLLGVNWARKGAHLDNCSNMKMASITCWISPLLKVH